MKLPPLLNRWSGVVECSVECHDCGWSGFYRKNGLALASLHARRTGHAVGCEQTIVVTYNRKERP